MKNFLLLYNYGTIFNFVFNIQLSIHNIRYNNEMKISIYIQFSPSISIKIETTPKNFYHTQGGVANS